MYTVLIVDDELLVQVGLQSMIDWTALGLRLLPCASNGQVAWEAILKDRPDLVITDIKMPVMDGLELIRLCRERLEGGPDFIVLTSHEDFAYAREAVKHHVIDYLVKLELTPEALTRAITSARVGRPAKQGVVAEEQPDQWLRHLTDSRQDATLFPGAAELQNRPLVVATCNLTDVAVETRPYAVKMIREILGREYALVPVSPNADNLVLILGAEPRLDPAAAETRVAASLAACLEMVQRYFNQTVVAGAGRSCSLAGVSVSYGESLKALESRGPLTVTLLSGDGFRTALEQALATLDGEALKTCFQGAREAIRAHGRLTEALDLGTAALYCVLASPGEPLLSSLFSHVPEGYKYLYSVPSTDHVVAWLETLELGLLNHIHGLGARHQEQLVDSMKRFVDSHFRERLPLKTVAEHFRLSPNYAGTQFRRFAGQSFSDYVAEVKVAKAREMLASQKYRVYEISEQLGFENTYYFSKVFRRVTGQSPREHRAQARPQSPDSE